MDDREKIETLLDTCEALEEWFRYGSIKRVLRDGKHTTLECGAETHHARLLAVIEAVK